MYKIYREGNYIRVIDVQTNQLFNGAIKEVFVDKNNTQKDIYTILNIKGLSKLVVAIPNILKSDGSAYSKAEWETFYTENTGNFNGGGTAPEIIFKSKPTYALMIADGTPTVPTIYSIDNDENKSYERSTYLWKPDGNREWIASTPDN